MSNPHLRPTSRSVCFFQSRGSPQASEVWSRASCERKHVNNCRILCHDLVRSVQEGQQSRSIHSYQLGQLKSFRELMDRAECFFTWETTETCRAIPCVSNSLRFPRASVKCRFGPLRASFDLLIFRFLKCQFGCLSASFGVLKEAKHLKNGK